MTRLAISLGSLHSVWRRRRHPRRGCAALLICWGGIHRLLVKPKARAIAIPDNRQASVNDASGCRLGGSFLHATRRSAARATAGARRINTGSRCSRRRCKGRARIVERWQRSEGIISGRSWGAWQSAEPLVGEHAADGVGMGWSCADRRTGREHQVGTAACRPARCLCIA
jgi:hypothetical protein